MDKTALDEKNTVKIEAGVMKRIMYKWKRMNESNTAQIEAEAMVAHW